MKWLAFGLLAVSLTACVSLPEVYLVDRHTVMEAEASGEWPELEQRFREQAPAPGPTALSKEPSDRRRDGAFRVLNGEFPNEPQASAQ